MNSAEGIKKLLVHMTSINCLFSILIYIGVVAHFKHHFFLVCHVRIIKYLCINQCIKLYVNALLYKHK